MSKDLVNRLCEAKKYQCKAIKALFPKKIATHLDVIEREVDEIAKELVKGIVNDLVVENLKSETEETKEKRVKKVDID